jgi:vitamin B12 transporter
MHIAARLTPLLLAAPAAAQQAAPPEVVVTGRGLPDTPGERAFDVVTIDRARLEAHAANRLESVLAEVAGLQQFRRSDSRSANPTSQGVTLRGLGGNAASRALLLLDGVPQADPFGGWVAFPAYAPDRLARVRVTRGGGSGYQGPGALAGTVELESAGAPGP